MTDLDTDGATTDHDAELGTEMTTAGNSALAAPLTTIDPLDRALAERDTLIELCLYALDRARSSGVAERLASGMDGVGVHLLRPDGERFDPSRHEAGGTLATDDPALDGLVAETEFPGFADRDRLVRPPVVTVYRASQRRAP